MTKIRIEQIDNGRLGIPRLTLDSMIARLGIKKYKYTDRIGDRWTRRALCGSL